MATDSQGDGSARVTTIVFVRHGHTALSLDDYMCGTTDPPLSASGVEMADAVGDAVAARAADGRWAALVASPLLRARQTAEAIGRRIGLPVTIEPGIREIAYGAWDGRRAGEVRRADPAAFARWAAHPATIAPPGGETAAAVAARAVPCIETLARRHAGDNILVVSHKSTIRIVLCALLGIDLDCFRTRLGAPVGSLTTVEFRDTGPFLRGLGDLSHLPAHLRAGAGA